MTTIKQLTQENDKLRLLLATSKADCAYCGLPAEAMAKCASGFPGCSRADDMLSDGTPTRQDLIDARDALAAQNVRLREALERATDAAKSYRSDILGCSGDNPNPRNESWMEGMCYAPKWEGRDSSIDIAVAALAFPLPQAARDVAEWRRDSERYRHIRTKSRIHWEPGENNRISWPSIYAEAIDGANYRNRFDAAIDAAMDADKGVK